MKTGHFIIIAIALLTLSSCEDKFKPASSDVIGKETPTHESWNSSVLFTDSSVTKAVLFAGHISVYTESAYTLIDSGAKVEFYKDEKIVSTLTGKRGKINDKTKDIEIFDSVMVVSSDSIRLNTSRLYWNNTTRKVSTEEFVKIKTPNEEIEGYGFESDQSLSNYRIFRVSGTFTK